MRSSGSGEPSLGRPTVISRWVNGNTDRNFVPSLRASLRVASQPIKLLINQQSILIYQLIMPPHATAVLFAPCQTSGLQHALRNTVKKSLQRLSKAINGDAKTEPQTLFKVL